MICIQTKIQLRNFPGNKTIKCHTCASLFSCNPMRLKHGMNGARGRDEAGKVVWMELNMVDLEYHTKKCELYSLYSGKSLNVLGVSNRIV